MPLSSKVNEEFDQWARTETWSKGNLPDEKEAYANASFLVNI